MLIISFLKYSLYLKINIQLIYFNILLKNHIPFCFTMKFLKFHNFSVFFSIADISKLHNQTYVDICLKTSKFLITVIIWWVCVTKKWNVQLLFVTNLWSSYFFFAKTYFLNFSNKKNQFLFFGQLSKKKSFDWLAQQNSSLNKKKKIFETCLFIFYCFHFG